MYGLGYKDSALHNANVGTDSKGSNDVWPAQGELRVRSGYDVWACVEGQETSEKTEVGACRRALDPEGRRGQILCQVAIGGRVPPDERKRSTIMDPQNLFNFLAKDASKPEDRGTVLTRWVVYKKGVRLEWKRPETFRNCAGANAYAVGRRTKSFTGAFLINAPTSGIAQLHDGDTKV